MYPYFQGYIRFVSLLFPLIHPRKVIHMMYVSRVDGLSKTYHSLEKYSESLYPTMHGIPGYFVIDVPLAVSLL